MAGFKACEALRHPVATRDSPEISASSLKPVIPRRRTSSSLLLLLSHHQGSRSSRLVFTFLRATCQLVPTLTLGCYAHFEQLETRHGTCNWIPVFTFKSILDELCVAHVRLPMHPLPPPPSHGCDPLSFPCLVPLTLFSQLRIRLWRSFSL